MTLAAASKLANIGTSEPQATAAFTPTSGSLILVGVVLAISEGLDPGDSINVSGLGGTWTKLGSVNFASRRRLWLFQSVGHAASSAAITFDYTGGGTVQEWGWVVDEFTGQHATPTASVGSTSGSGIAGTVSSGGSPVAGDGTYSVLGLENNVDATPEAGWAPLGETTTGSLGVRRVESAWDDAADTSHAWSWGATAGYGAIIVIVKTADGGTAHARTIQRVVSTHTG